MTTFSGSQNFQSIEFPKQWFATPWREREQIFQEFVDKEMAVVDSVLNPDSSAEDGDKTNHNERSSSSDSESPRLAVPEEIVQSRSPSPKRHTTVSPRSSTSSSTHALPNAIDSWQERHKKIDQRINKEIEKTDRILKNAQQFKADLLQWMERLKDPPPDPLFSPRPTEDESKQETSDDPSLSEPSLDNSSSTMTTSVEENNMLLKETQEDLAKIEERLRIGRQKYTAQQAVKRIVKSLQEHLREYLKLEQSVDGQSSASCSSHKSTNSAAGQTLQTQAEQTSRSAAMWRRASRGSTPERARTMWARIRPISTDRRRLQRKPPSPKSALVGVRLPGSRAQLTRRTAGSLPPISQRLAPHASLTSNGTPFSPRSIMQPLTVQSLSLSANPLASPKSAPGGRGGGRRKIVKKWEPSGVPEASKPGNNNSKFASQRPMITLGTMRSLEDLVRRDQEREWVRSTATGTHPERIRNRLQRSSSYGPLPDTAPLRPRLRPAFNR